MTTKGTLKMALRLALLLVVAGSVGYLFAKEYGRGGWEAPPAVPAPVVAAAKTEAPPLRPNRVAAYYFHGHYRCAACNRIEEFTQDAIRNGFPVELKDGSLSFESVNVEEPQNRHFIRDYDLVSKSVVLSLKAGDDEVRFRNLQNVWRLLGSKEKFEAYVKDETRAMLMEVNR